MHCEHDGFKMRQFSNKGSQWECVAGHVYRPANIGGDMTDDMPGLEEAIRIGSAEYHLLKLGRIQCNAAPVAVAIEAAYPIIAAAVREQVAREIEALGRSQTRGI